MTKYEEELIRLINLGDKFIPPPPMMTDKFHKSKDDESLSILAHVEKLEIYQRLTGKDMGVRMLLYKSKLNLLDV